MGLANKKKEPVAVEHPAEPQQEVAVEGLLGLSKSQEPAAGQVPHPGSDDAHQVPQPGSLAAQVPQSSGDDYQDVEGVRALPAQEAAGSKVTDWLQIQRNQPTHSGVRKALFSSPSKPRVTAADNLAKFLAPASQKGDGLTGPAALPGGSRAQAPYPAAVQGGLAGPAALPGGSRAQAPYPAAVQGGQVFTPYKKRKYVDYETSSPSVSSAAGRK